MATTSDKLKRLKQTGIIDGVEGAGEVGRLLDLHNEFVEKEKEKHMVSEINARNLYYVKLWLMAAEELRSGRKSIAPPEKKPTFHI